MRLRANHIRDPNFRDELGGQILIIPIRNGGPIVRLVATSGGSSFLPRSGQNPSLTADAASMNQSLLINRSDHRRSTLACSTKAITFCMSLFWPSVRSVTLFCDAAQKRSNTMANAERSFK